MTSLPLGLRTTEWLCEERHLQEGVLTHIGTLAMSNAAATLKPKGRFLGIFGHNYSFFRTLPPDGRDATFRARVVHRLEDVLTVRLEVTDAAGELVAEASETVTFAPAPQQTSAAERRLVTVLYTDIVSSTEQTSRMGDERWRRILDGHHAITRRQLQLHGGREIKTTGDGFLATFESAAQTVRCADAIWEGVRPLGLEIRAGVHTGEVEFGDGDISGIAATIAKRVQDAAGPGEILASSTVRDVVTGSGLEFVGRGVHELKGVPGSWQLYEVAR